ncbi:ribonuclease Y [Truepera radiovictrix]|uniref:Ribonuclease Y n=1 Tax=Truepera radiovictrix (strain DSM 17093 / CIP 108686 / LMG 22925 / RQ-24) TaxID=649638 RepID=D7CRT5_TRURR|nr:ribonuclease Y [Truepera radiovictrix]ADI15263.1 metal dependent phosphohydrolase [Truepera radiovictrix DSM 17093]WMT56186.1 ribonuclease Y [Truepera radiovictrix]
MGGFGVVLALLLGLLIGGAVGLLWRRQRDDEIIARAEAEADKRRRSAQEEAQRLVAAAQARSDELLAGARERLEEEARRAKAALDEELRRTRQVFDFELARLREDAERDRESARELREELRRDRERLDATEERLTRRGEQQDARALKLDDLEERLDRREEALEAREEALEAQRSEVERRLYEVAQLTRESATEMILAKLDSELEREKAVRIRAQLERADSEAKRKSTNILAQAVQRSASEVSAAISVSVVPIPSDAMKGRIIGREGRNIRAFESLTGVDLIIDDTPEAVLLSSFNPIRREVAKLALTELVTDGRIHPARIEETVQKAQSEMQSYIRERGEEAALEANVVGLKPGMLQLLGRMHFRTSYGQNVLKHSVQVAHLTGIIAAEIGLDEALARRAGLLHDIGKSIDREIEGTHTEIGANLARRFGEPDEVVDAIAHHHELELAETLYPVIVSAADAISAARPGARRESLESYLKRLEGLETIATSFPGVEKSYAIQAGREIRIIVEPDKVDDASAVLLARDIANRIEQDMEYPGQVQVTVVRESRAVQYAR